MLPYVQSRCTLQFVTQDITPHRIYVYKRLRTIVSQQKEGPMKFSAKSVRIGIIVASLYMGIYKEAQAQTASQNPLSETVSERPSSLASQAAYDSTLNEDAMHLSKARGISFQNALVQLKIDAAVTGPVARLRETYSDRLAGIYVEHEPTPRIVVRLKGGARPTTHIVNTSAGVVPVDFIVGAAHTQAELHDVLEAKLLVLKAALPNLQGTATDEKTGEVVLYILGDDAMAAEAQNAANRILGVPTKVRALPAPVTQEVRGSGSIDNGTCTGAFVVQKTDGSATGLLTAGHCPNNNASYTGLDGAVASLTFQAEAYTASNDVQWYKTNTTNEPIFYASAGVSRTLTGRRTQASTAIGTNVCHYGVTSGYSCGNVEFTDYQPPYLCNGVTCTKTYIGVTSFGPNNTLACGAGDSGGPWFISTVATGVHSGGSSTGPAVGACLIAIYTSTDLISALGLQLVYGP
jgi:streptogrisin C